MAIGLPDLKYQFTLKCEVINISRGHVTAGKEKQPRFNNESRTGTIITILNLGR